MTIAKEIYDELSKTYDDLYVNDRDSSYMKDEHDAARHFKNCNFEPGKILSLGCGTGQDVEICGFPKPENYVGYDISEGMLSKARQKFTNYSFNLQDCNFMIDTNADILVSMFGTPNYIGIDLLNKHYDFTGCRNAFLVFYNEDYEDGVIGNYHRTTKEDLICGFSQHNAVVKPLSENSNYYVVSW